MTRSASRVCALLLVGATALSGCGMVPDDFAGQGPTRTSATSPPPSPSPSPSQAQSPSRSASPSQVTPTPSPSEEPEPIPANPNIERLPDRQWQRIVEAGMWRPGCPVRRNDLRRVEIDYNTFDGDVRRGVLVVNRDIADSVARIFSRLFEIGFPIRRMRPAERYGGDANASLAVGNTSAYNCRRLDQINAPPLESPHANGRAIDVNPRLNPWVDLRCDCWFPSPRHRKRTPAPGKVIRGNEAWEAFIDEGWIWQNIDVPDYMHFDTGYPSRPYRGLEEQLERQQRQRKRLNDG